MPRIILARRAYSLVEVLVAVAILALLTGLMLAAVQKVRTRAARASDENNLRQVALAAGSYDSQHGRLPPLVDMKRYPAPLPDAPTWGARWAVPAAVFLVPHLDGPPLASLYAGPVAMAGIHGLTVPAYTSPRDASHTGGRLDRFRLPVYNGDDLSGVGNYAFNVWAFGGPNAEVAGSPIAKGGFAWSMNDRGASLGGGFPDGTSHTLLLATKQGRCGDLGGGSLFASARFTGFVVSNSQYAQQHTAAAFFGHRLPSADGTGPTFQTIPNQADCDADLAHGFERGLISVAMADGSVRAISAGISPTLWRAGLLPADGTGLPAE